MKIFVTTNIYNNKYLLLEIYTTIYICYYGNYEKTLNIVTTNNNRKYLIRKPTSAMI